MFQSQLLNRRSIRFHHSRQSICIINSGRSQEVLQRQNASSAAAEGEQRDNSSSTSSQIDSPKPISTSTAKAHTIVKVAKETTAGALAGSLFRCLCEKPHLRLLFTGTHPSYTSAKALGLVNLMHHNKTGKLVFFIPQLDESIVEGLPAAKMLSLRRYFADVYCEDLVEHAVEGEITKVPDRAQDWRAYRKSRELNEERAHQMADVIYEALLSDGDAVVVASTHGEVTTAMHSLALCNRRLAAEGADYALGCTVYLEGALRKGAQHQKGLLFYAEKRGVALKAGPGL